MLNCTYGYPAPISFVTVLLERAADGSQAAPRTGGRRWLTTAAAAGAHPSRYPYVTIPHHASDVR